MKGVPSEATWVCFTCRTAVRRVSYYAHEVPCSTCGDPCQALGYKIRIPARRHAKAWKKLEADLAERQRKAEADRREREVRQRHDVEREIARLAAMPANRGRSRAIQLLRKGLKKR